ncbi:MAG: YfbR-like 5'-deoxynucleotidase [Aeromonas veronii]
MLNKEKFLAYGDRHELETVMRLHSVKRWHMIDTTRQQTLAEHTANVAMLTFILVQKFPWLVEKDPRPSTFAVMAALVHDIAESFTGDIPTHTKQHLEGLQALEDEVVPRMFQFTWTEEVALLVKLCDLADGIRFIRLHGVDGTARHAREGLEKQLAERRAQADELWGQDFAAVFPYLLFYAYENS